MKKAMLRVRQTVVVGALFVLAVVPREARAVEKTLFGAHMQRPEVVVSPETNGMMAVTCKVGFIGGCCFPLTSHDVAATLEVPQGIAVVTGPEPANYAAIEAPVSGKAQAWASFRWCLKRTAPDAGDSLTVTVTSADSEQVKAACAMDQQSRISIKGPQLPEVMPAGQDLALTVDAACLDQDRFAKSVRFWYSTEIPAGAEAVDVPADLVGRGILRFATGGRQLMVQGQAVDLARKYEPTVWNGVLPSQKHGPLYGVAVAVDDSGRASHGPVVRLAAPTPAFWGPWFAKLFTFRKEPVAAGCPADSSTVVYLFLDGGESSRRLAEQMETYRRAVPHRIHVLSFVEGITPAPLLESYCARYHVVQTPTAVFDGQVSIDGTNGVAVAGTLDRCFGKPSPRLSMELHGGVIAGHQLSLGFIMCNHASRLDAHGSLAAFGFENNVSMDGWRCDHVVRQLMVAGRQFAIPTGKCQPPAMMTWDIPQGVAPPQVGALIVILDAQGRLIDSICTERPCARTGICG